MSGAVTTTVGGHLADHSMRVKIKDVLVSPDWKSKDRPFGALAPALANRVGHWESNSDFIISNTNPISSQGEASTCGSNAWLDLLEILDEQEGNDKVEQYSRRFLYWLARAYVGDTGRDAGSYNRASAHQLRKIGVVEEKYFPYSDKVDMLVGPEAVPPTDLYVMASNNRLNGFYRADEHSPDFLDDMELSIRARHPFVFGAPVSDAYTQATGWTIFGPPNKIDVIGSHAMICIGVLFDGDVRHWLLRNSWSRRWGFNGLTKVTDAYVRQFKDVWVGTQMKALT